jgi:hypothetical protein
LNFSEIDLVPDEIMNRMLWACIKGENAKLPVPVRAAFVKPIKNPEEKD